MSASPSPGAFTSALELRILTGRHAGARVPAGDGLVLGQGLDDGADIILSDLDPRSGQARLQLVEQNSPATPGADPPLRWGLHSAGPEAGDGPVEARVEVLAALGAVRRWGGVALCVCSPDTPWQANLDLPAPEGPEPPVRAGAALPPAWHRRIQPARARPALVFAALTLGIVLAAAWPMGKPPSFAAAAAVPTQVHGPQAPGPEAQDVPAALPTPGLALERQADGRLRITGWVDSLAELDRLTDALASSHPHARQHLLVLPEVRADLRAALGGAAAQLSFTPEGPGRLRVRGQVRTDEERRRTLSTSRAELPEGVQLLDGLRDQTPEPAPWPLALEAPRKRHAAPPFPIRSVVDGHPPHVVAADGSLLLPGSWHAGWRLQAITPAALVFDAPQRRVVAR